MKKKATEMGYGENHLKPVAAASAAIVVCRQAGDEMSRDSRELTAVAQVGHKVFTSVCQAGAWATIERLARDDD